MDPILLVGWALEGGEAQTFLDVGTGCGVMALLLARLGLKGKGIDVMPEAIELARRSAKESGMSTVFQVMDARELPRNTVDLVLCNPPYFPLSRGTPSSNPLRAASRHECHGSLSQIISACCRSGDRVCISLPTGRLDEGRVLLSQYGRPVARELRLDEGFGLLEGRRSSKPSQVERGSLREGGGHGPIAARLFARAGAILQHTASSEGL